MVQANRQALSVRKGVVVHHGAVQSASRGRCCSRIGGLPDCRVKEPTPDRAGCLLQHPGVRLNPPTFKPLGPDEAPKAGTLLAIDTEFVAHSPPDKVFKGCALCKHCRTALTRAQVLAESLLLCVSQATPLL